MVRRQNLLGLGSRPPPGIRLALFGPGHRRIAVRDPGIEAIPLHCRYGAGTTGEMAGTRNRFAAGTASQIASKARVSSLTSMPRILR